MFHRRRNRWLGEASEAAAPLLRAASRLAARRAPSEPSSWRRGLIIGQSHIGDVLYRTASLAPLRALLPACSWSYLCAPGTAELLAHDPALAEVLPLARGVHAWSLARGAFGTLRERDFDVVLCTNTLALHGDFALAVALGVPNRVGFAHKGLSGLLTHRAPLRFPSPYPAYFRSMVADVGGGAGDWPLRPRVHRTVADRAAAARCWEELALDPSLPVVACGLTTRQHTGNWPRAQLVEALRLARRETAFELLLCGASADAPVLAAAAGELGFPVRVLAGALSLRPFVELLSRCAALVTLDTGTRHLGNAAGIPVLFARNLMHNRVEAGAYCDTEIELAPPAEYLSDAEIAAVAAATPPSATARSILDALAAAPRRA